MSRLGLYKRTVPESYVKIKYYLTHQNEVNDNKIVSYCEALNINKHMIPKVLHYVKLANRLPFQNRLPKGAPPFNR